MGEEHVKLVVQMVGVLAWTARDAGLSLVQNYILFTKVTLVVSKKILFIKPYVTLSIISGLEL